MCWRSWTANEGAPMTTIPDAAEIIAALPLRPRPALSLPPPNSASNTGALLVLEAPEDPDEGDGIIGLALHDDDGWYLGCIKCSDKIEEADSGMCQSCRQDAEWNEQVRADEYYEG